MYIKWFEPSEVKDNEIAHVLTRENLRIAKILLGEKFEQPHIAMGGFGVFTIETGKQFLPKLKANVLQSLYIAVGLRDREGIHVDMDREISQAQFHLSCYRALELAIQEIEARELS